MADTPGIISSKIIIDTSQVDQATKKIQSFRDAIKEAKKSDSKSTFFDGEIRSLSELQKGLKSAQEALDKYNRSIKSQSPSNNYINLQSQIRAATNEAERLYMVQKKSGAVQDITAYNNARTALTNLTSAQNGYNESMGRSTGLLDGFQRRVKSHMEWMTSGLLLSGAFAVPMEAIKSIKDVDQAMAGMQQVIPELHHSQQALNEEAMKFIDIASLYGEKIEDIIKAGQSWGRMYKDLNIVNALTHQSAVVAVADNMSLIAANKGVEASMFQYGLVAKDTAEAMAYSGRIIDVVTKLAHTAGTTAQDLFAAIERTGSVAKMAGVDFEFLSAMIATATRSSQLSGENIGNMFKSVLGSIHSEKATKEIEALGIATKKVGVDGTVELRKAQDVLLDIAVQAQGSEKNLEDLFKAVSGGKFQWAKTAAMLGDYKTFIETWGSAVSSAGFAIDQVQMQMDTITRRIKGITADLQGLAVEGGNNGLTKYIKEQLAGIDNLVMGVKNIPSVITDVVMKFTLLSIALSMASKVYNTYTAAALEATAATTAFGRATIFLSKTNIVVAGLSVLAIVLGTYVEKLGEANNAERNATQLKQDGIAAQEQQLEQMKKQSEFIDSMFGAREKLIAQSEDETKTAEKKIMISQDIEATEQELTKVLGTEAMERIRQNNFSAESIETEKTIFQNAVTAKQIALNNMRTAMSADLDNKILWLQNCVKAYYDEAAAFGDSISKKITMLGIWKAAILTAQEWNTKFHENLGQLNRDAAERETDPNQKAKFLEMANAEDQKVADSRAKGQAIIDEGAANWKKQLRDAMAERLTIASGGINWSSGGAGGNNYEPLGGTTKDKSSGAMPPSDYTTKITKDAWKDAQTKAFHEAKLSADRYKESLDNITTSEEINGKTVSSSIERYTAMQSRITQLSKEEAQYTNEAQYLNGILDDRISSSQDLLNIVGYSKAEWDSLSKAKRASVKLDNREYLAQHELTKAGVTIVQQYEEKASSARIEINGLNNDLTKLNKANEGNTLYQSNRRISGIKDQESINIANKTNKLDPNNSIELNKIKLQSLLDQQKEYEDQKAYLEDQYRQLMLTKTGQAKIAQQQQLLDDLRKVQVIYAQNAEQIKQLEYDKDAKIKEGLEGITQEVLLQGNSLKSVWKNLWNQLANDALKALFRVQNSSGGLLSSLLGVFGGGAAKGSGLTRGGFTPSNSWMPSTAFSFQADGDILDKPTPVIAGEAGEEAFINLDKLQRGDKRQQGLLSYANSKLGTHVEAKVSQKTLDIAKNASVETRMNREHINELQKANALMAEQNRMILYMINNGNQGNTTIAQPVVMQGTQSDEALFAQLGRMRNMGYNV